MADKEEILIEIVVSNEAAAKAIFENQQSVERLKNTQLELTKARKAGTITEEDYSKKSTAVKVAIDSQKESIRQNEKELRNNIKTQKDGNDSLVSMRAQLSNNIKAYDAMSQAQLNTAEGKEFTKSILDLNEKIKDAEESSGRFQRNVGNYPGLTKEAGKGVTQMTGFLGKMESQIGLVSPRMGAMVSAFSGFAGKTAAAASDAALLNKELKNSGDAMGAVEGFAGKASGSLNNLATTSNVAGKASTGAFASIASGAKSLGMIFLTPPIIIIAAVVGAIVGAFMLLKKGFELNDAAGDKMGEAMATLQPIFDAIGKVAGLLAGAIADLVGFFAEAISGTVDFIAGLLGMESGMSGAAKQARDLAKAENELEDAERNFTVNSAERQLKRAKLLAEVADKEKNSAEQRIAYLKDASELDKKELEEKKANAIKNLVLITLRANAEKNTSDEVADKIAAARVRALNATKEYFEGEKEINKKLSAAQDEMDSEQKAIYDKWKQRKDEQLKKETDLLRQLEDLVIANIKNDLERQIEAEQTKTERANFDLKARLKNEENLTKEARKAIENIISLNEQNLTTKVNELKNKALEENIRKEIDAKAKTLEAEIQLSKKNSVDELNLKIARLEVLKSAELNNLKLTNVERLAIIDKFDKQELELSDKYLIGKEQRLRDSLNKEFDLRILNADKNNMFVDEQSIIEQEKAQFQYDALINLDANTKSAMYATQLDYELAVAQSQNNLIATQDKVLLEQIKGLDTFNSSMRSISNSIGSLISEMSNESYEAAQYARALALVNIGIALSEGIAGAIKASATAAKDPITFIASILSGMAAVGAAIGASRKAFAETPVPKKPAFATGGLIRGQGTGTSDSIDARVSNGESIMNANSTAMFTPLLSALNQAGGGVGFGSSEISNQVQGEEMLARAFAKGVSMMPAPVVSVKEITKVTNRVTVLENL